MEAGEERGGNWHGKLKPPCLLGGRGEGEGGASWLWLLQGVTSLIARAPLPTQCGAITKLKGRWAGVARWRAASGSGGAAALGGRAGIILLAAPTSLRTNLACEQAQGGMVRGRRGAQGELMPFCDSKHNSGPLGRAVGGGAWAVGMRQHGWR